MREILFRGKLTDNCEWAYGVPTKDNHGEMVMVESTFECEEYNCRGANCLYVDENTVGQYIGLTDKNGKKIFEGDIVKYKNTLPCFECLTETLNKPCKIAYINSQFVMMWKNFYRNFERVYDDEIEVIGNIHDNPELLEAQK